MSSVAPTIKPITGDEPLVAVLGRPLTISVFVEARPKPNVKWQIGRKRVKESAKYHLKCEEVKDRYDLIVQKATEDLNEGVWVVASNQAGEDCCHLIVQTIAASNSNPSYVDITNENVTITEKEVHVSEDEDSIKITEKHRTVKHKRTISMTEINSENLDKYLGISEVPNISVETNITVPKRKIKNGVDRKLNSSESVSETNLDDPYIRLPKKVKNKKPKDVNQLKDENNNIDVEKTPQKQSSIKKPKSNNNNNNSEALGPPLKNDDVKIKVNGPKNHEMIETDLDKFEPTGKKEMAKKKNNKIEDEDDEEEEIDEKEKEEEKKDHKNSKQDVLWEIYGKNVIELCNEILKNYDYGYVEDTDENERESSENQGETADEEEKDETKEMVNVKNKNDDKKVDKMNDENTTGDYKKNKIVTNNDKSDEMTNKLENKLPRSFSNSKNFSDENVHVPDKQSSAAPKVTPDKIQINKVDTKAETDQTEKNEDFNKNGQIDKNPSKNDAHANDNFKKLSTKPAVDPVEKKPVLNTKPATNESNKNNELIKDVKVDIKKPEDKTLINDDSVKTTPNIATGPIRKSTVDAKANETEKDKDVNKNYPKKFENNEPTSDNSKPISPPKNEDKTLVKDGSIKTNLNITTGPMQKTTVDPKADETKKDSDSGKNDPKKSDNKKIFTSDNSKPISPPKNEEAVTILKGNDGKPKFYINKIDNVPIVPNLALVMPKKHFPFKPQTDFNTGPLVTTKPPPHLPTASADSKPKVLTTYVVHKRYPSYRNLLEANMNMSTSKKHTPRQYPNTPRQQKKLDKSRSRSVDLLNKKADNDDDENADISQNERSWDEANTLPSRPKSTDFYMKTKLLPSRSEELLVIKGSRLRPSRLDDSGSRNDLFRSYQSLNTDSEQGSVSSKMGKRTMSREWERVVVTTTEETFLVSKDDDGKTKIVKQPVKVSTETSTTDFRPTKPDVTKVEKGSGPDKSNVGVFQSSNAQMHITGSSQTPIVITADKNMGPVTLKFVDGSVGTEDLKTNAKSKTITSEIGIGTDAKKVTTVGRSTEAKPSTGFSSQQTEPVIISKYPTKHNDSSTQTDKEKEKDKDENVIPVTITSEYPVINLIPVKEEVKPQEYITSAESYEYGEIITFYDENSEKGKEFAKLRKKEYKDKLKPLFSIEHLNALKPINFRETDITSSSSNAKPGEIETTRFQTVLEADEPSKNVNSKDNLVSLDLNYFNNKLNIFDVTPSNLEQGAADLNESKESEAEATLNDHEQNSDLMDFSTDDDLLTSTNISFFNPKPSLIENTDLKPSLRYNSNTFKFQNKKPDLLLTSFESNTIEQNNLTQAAHNPSEEIVEEMINSLNNGSNVSIHNNSYDKLIESVNSKRCKDKYYGSMNNFTWDFLNREQSQELKRRMKLSPMDSKRILLSNSDLCQIVSQDFGDSVDKDDHNIASNFHLEGSKPEKVSPDGQNLQNENPNFPHFHKEMIEEKERFFNTISYISFIVLFITAVLYFILRNFTEMTFLRY